MKKSISLFLLLSLGFSSIAFASWDSPFTYSTNQPNYTKEMTSNISENSSFNYTGLSIAGPFPIPGISVGHREKFDQSAIDYSTNFTSNILVSAISFESSYLKYLGENKYYFGGGAGVGLGFILHAPALFAFYPNVSFGKENEKNFHQVSASALYFSNHGISVSPGISYTFGYKF